MCSFFILFVFCPIYKRISNLHGVTKTEKEEEPTSSPKTYMSHKLAVCLFLSPFSSTVLIIIIVILILRLPLYFCYVNQAISWIFSLLLPVAVFLYSEPDCPCLWCCNTVDATRVEKVSEWKGSTITILFFSYNNSVGAGYLYGAEIWRFFKLLSV